MFLVTNYFSEYLNPPGRKRRRNQSAQDVNPASKQKPPLAPQAAKPSLAKPQHKKSPPKNAEVPKVVENGHVKKLASEFQNTIDLNKGKVKKNLSNPSSVQEPITIESPESSPGLGFISESLLET